MKKEHYEIIRHCHKTGVTAEGTAGILYQSGVYNKRFFELKFIVESLFERLKKIRRDNRK